MNDELPKLEVKGVWSEMESLRKQLAEAQRQITQARIEELEWCAETLESDGNLNIFSKVCARIQQLKTGGDETCRTQTTASVSPVSPNSCGSPAPEVTNGASPHASAGELLHYLNSQFPATFGHLALGNKLMQLEHRGWHRGMTEAAELRPAMQSPQSAEGRAWNASLELFEKVILETRDNKA